MSRFQTHDITGACYVPLPSKPPGHPTCSLDQKKQELVASGLFTYDLHTNPNWLFLECQEAKFSIYYQSPQLVFTFLVAFASDLHVPLLGLGNKGPDDLNCFKFHPEEKKEGKKEEALIITINRIRMLHM